MSTTIAVRSGDDLLAAIRNNDEVVIENGAVFTGNFILPVKATPTLIRAATPPPVGTRAIATHALPKIVSPNAGPALEILDADNYKFVGIDFTVADNVSLNFGVVHVGNGQETRVDQLPANITFERCLIHGNATGDMKRGLEAHAVNITVADSSIYNIRGVGHETQAFVSWNGAGPFTLTNNYLEAGSENVMFGGADPKIPNLVPSDIRITRNLFSKPMSWNPNSPSFAGKRWSVKNLFELKNARRVHAEGNIFENCWVDGQIGFAIQFTPRNQDGTAPWSTVEDVTFINNIVRNSAGGVNILGSDDIHPSQHAARIKIENNLFYNIGGSLFGINGRMFQIVGNGAQGVMIRKTTTVHTDGNLIVFDGQNHTGFIYEDNINVNSQGIRGSGTSEGSGALAVFAPGASVTGNVIQGRPAASYPAGNLFPASVSEIGFIDSANGNYGLNPSSPFVGKGANVAAINAAIAGEVRPPPIVSLSALSVNPTSVVGDNSSQGSVTLTGPAPSGGAVVSLSDNSASANTQASVTVGAGATSATFTITTGTVTASTAVTITGSFGGVTRTATLTVQPPPTPTVALETTSVPVVAMESAAVAFTLSQAAKARVEFGLEGSFTNTTAVQASAVNHLVILSGLRSNRKHNYRVVIIDSAGAETKSNAFGFTTCRTCR